MVLKWLFKKQIINIICILCFLNISPLCRISGFLQTDNLSCLLLWIDDTVHSVLKIQYSQVSGFQQPFKCCQWMHGCGSKQQPVLRQLCGSRNLTFQWHGVSLFQQKSMQAKGTLGGERQTEAKRESGCIHKLEKPLCLHTTYIQVLYVKLNMCFKITESKSSSYLCRNTAPLPNPLKSNHSKENFNLTLVFLLWK